MTKDDLDDEAKKKEAETRCPIPCLQGGAKMSVFTVVICLYALSYGTLNAYYSSMITTIEKTYGFSGSQSSWIIGSYEIGFIVSIMFISYYGYRSHRPRWLGAAGILIGVCSLLMAIPYFVFAPTWNYDENAILSSGTYFHELLCNLTTRTGTGACPGGVGEKTPTDMNVFAIKITALTLAGFGPTALWTLGLTFIDDNSDPPRSAPLFLGFVLCARQLAPILGYVLGFITAEIYVDLSDTKLTSDDPNFIGCWWLGYLIIGFLTILTSIPLTLFPRKLVMTSEVKEKRDDDDASRKPSVQPIRSVPKTSSSHGDDAEAKVSAPSVAPNVAHPSHSSQRQTGIPDLDFFAKRRISGDNRRQSGQQRASVPKVLHHGTAHRRKSVTNAFSADGHVTPSTIIQYDEDHYDLERRNLAGLLKSMIRLFRNPVFMCSALADAFTTAAIYGYVTYVPKYMELQFGIDAGSSAIYTGYRILSAVCAAMVSAFGIALSGYLTTKLNWPLRQSVARGNFILLIGGLLPLILMSFSCPHPFIRGVTHFSPVSEAGLELECNKNCHCTSSLFQPVCGVDKVTYFNPCFAGCVTENLKTEMPNSYADCSCIPYEGTAISGTCGMAGCNTITIYLILLVVVAMLISLPMVPYAMLILRCVDECDKSVAFGLDSLLASVGAFAVTLLFGAVVDAGCAVLRPTGSCGVDQSMCLIYDMDSFRYQFHVLMSCLLLIAPTLRFIASYKAQDMVLEDDEEDEDESETSYLEDIENSAEDFPQEQRNDSKDPAFKLGSLKSSNDKIVQSISEETEYA